MITYHVLYAEMPYMEFDERGEAELFLEQGGDDLDIDLFTIISSDDFEY